MYKLLILFDVINPLILFLTLLVIILYTWETRGMKKQMIKQKELSMRPLIVIDHDGSHYVLKNVGYGPAIETRMDDITIVKLNKTLTFKIDFKKVGVLAREETAPLYTGNQDEATPYVFDEAAIDPRYAAKPFDFLISYRDLGNNAYSTSGIFGKGGIVSQRPDQAA